MIYQKCIFYFHKIVIPFIESLQKCFSALKSEFLTISTIWAEASVTYGKLSTTDYQTQTFLISMLDFATIVTTLTENLLTHYANVGATLETFRSSILMYEN